MGLNPVAKNVHRGGLVLKSRPLVTMASNCKGFLEQHDGRAVKAPSITMRTDYIYARLSWVRNPVDKKVHIGGLALQSCLHNYDKQPPMRLGAAGWPSGKGIEHHDDHGRNNAR